MNKELLILGIDPGTTVGYSLINLTGNLVKLGSKKELSIHKLFLETLNHGKIVMVSTDVNPASKYVSKFSKKVGAALLFPENSLLIKEKKKLTKEYSNEKIIKNRHQRDALASAIFAHKKIKHLLSKIDVKLTKNKKEDLSYEVKKLLLTKTGLSIDGALSIVEHN